MGLCHTDQTWEFPQDRVRDARPDRPVVGIEPPGYRAHFWFSNQLPCDDHNRTVPSSFVTIGLAHLGYCHANRPQAAIGANLGRTSSPAMSDLKSRLDELFWYHTIDVAPGITTKGMFDNRHALSIIPFPDLRGKRCLDVGTCDGLYAFHMEQRGAAEVVAVDLSDLTDLDYPPEVRHQLAYDPSRSHLGPSRPGFDLLHEVLGSRVKWRGCNVYDLNRDDLGVFDVVVVGSLLLHLRDPVRALNAVRGVVGGQLIVADYVHTPLMVRSRRRPLFELRGEGPDFQWWVGNDRGNRQLLQVSGFNIEKVSRYFVLRFGPELDKEYVPKLGLRETVNAVINGALTGDRRRGHLHRAYRCRPRF